MSLHCELLGWLVLFVCSMLATIRRLFWLLCAASIVGAACNKCRTVDTSRGRQSHTFSAALRRSGLFTELWLRRFQLRNVRRLFLA